MRAKGTGFLACAVLLAAAAQWACSSGSDGDADADGDGACSRGDYEGDLRLQSVEELAGYTALSGSLTIVDTELTSLAGLECLRIVSGDLSIANNDALASLDGLGGLTSIGYEPCRADDGGCGTGFLVLRNAVLRDLDGLSALTSLDGRLGIIENAALESVEGLSGLTSVGRTFGLTMAESITITDNPALTSLRGLSGITSTEAAVIIQRNAALTDLDGLDGLTTLGAHQGDEDTSDPSSLVIDDNGALRSLEGLGGLTSLDGDLAITSNAMLPTCEADALVELLQSLGWAEDAIITGNDDSATCE